AGGWVGQLTQSAKLVGSDSLQGDFFGQSLTIAGDTIGVGTYFDQRIDPGAVYLFDRPPTGWQGVLKESERIVASDAPQGDGFGADVGSSGVSILIGAPRTTSDRGGGSIFELPAASPSPTTTFTATQTATPVLTSTPTLSETVFETPTATASATPSATET